MEHFHEEMPRIKQEMGHFLLGMLRSKQGKPPFQGRAVAAAPPINNGLRGNAALPIINRYLLTSRPAGLEQVQLPHPDHRRMWRVLPFNIPEKLRFTEQWYQYFLDEPTERENYTRSCALLKPV